MSARRHELARAAAIVALLCVSCTPPPLKGTQRGELHVSVEGSMGAPALTSSFDVGGVQVGLTKAITVAAINVGVDPLKVLSASAGSTGNGSWFVRDVTGSLAPGASLTTTVTFAPVAAGPQTTTITFSHDADAAFPSLALSGQGL